MTINTSGELRAAMWLYRLLSNSKGNPKYYIMAADKETAAICYNAMKKMAEQEIGIMQRVKTVDSCREIRLRDGSGFVKVLSADAENKHGYNPSCVIFDELHAQPNRKL